MAFPHPATLLGLSLALAVTGARAQVSEAELKAAFVYNFAAFTHWPQDVLPTGEPIAICAMADTRQAKALEQLSRRTVAGRAVTVSATGAGPCHVLLYQPEAVAPGAGAGALTVCDGPAQVCRDAVITLVREGDRIRFEVNAAQARTRRLSLSSKLLRLARKVR